MKSNNKEYKQQEPENSGSAPADESGGGTDNSIPHKHNYKRIGEYIYQCDCGERMGFHAMIDTITMLVSTLLTVKEMVKQGQYFKIGSFIDRAIEDMPKRKIKVIKHGEN